MSAMSGRNFFCSQPEFAACRDIADNKDDEAGKDNDGVKWRCDNDDKVLW